MTDKQYKFPCEDLTHATYKWGIEYSKRDGRSAMKLVHIQQALFAAYDIRNAMTSDDKYRPTEGESMGKCLDEIINTLENLEDEIEKEEQETEHYSEIFYTNHGEIK